MKERSDNELASRLIVGGLTGEQGRELADAVSRDPQLAEDVRVQVAMDSLLQTFHGATPAEASWRVVQERIESGETGVARFPSRRVVWAGLLAASVAAVCIGAYLVKQRTGAAVPAVAVSPAERTGAVVEEIRGQCRAEKADGTAVALVPGMAVEDGMRIHTGADSEARLALSDGAVGVSLAADSDATVLARGGQGQLASVFMGRGTVTSDVKVQGTPYTVRAEGVAVRVLGTRFQVALLREAAERKARGLGHLDYPLFWVKVDRGSVELANPHGVAVLAPGEEGVVPLDPEAERSDVQEGCIEPTGACMTPCSACPNSASCAGKQGYTHGKTEEGVR